MEPVGPGLSPSPTWAGSAKAGALPCVARRGQNQPIGRPPSPGLARPGTAQARLSP